MHTSNRSLAERFGVIDTRSSAPLEKRLMWIQPKRFAGTANSEALDPRGFDILVDPDDKTKLHIAIINGRPSRGSIHDKLSSVIEYFTMSLGGSTMTHVRTFTSPAIEAPSHVTWVDENLFVFTGAHKVGGSVVSG